MAGTPFTEGTYEIVLQDRETGRPVPNCELDIEVAQFNRGPHIYSGAFVELGSPPAYDCSRCGRGDCGCEPNGRAVELAFYRDDWKEAAWIGPVTSMGASDSTGTFTIRANDRLWWLEGATSDRTLDQSLPANQAFIKMVEAADRYEPSGLLYDDHTVPDSDVEFALDVDIGDLLWSPMLALDSLVFWTVVGEQLYWGSPTLPLKCGETLRSSTSWIEGGVEVERQFGSITRAVMVGKDGIKGVYPLDGDADPLSGQGKRTLETSNVGLDTQAEVDAVAKSLYLANRYPADFVVSGESSLGTAHNFGLENLIPGRCYDVVKDSGCLQTTENKLLSRVIVDIAKVTDDDGQQALRELRVAADFSPISTTSTPASVSA